MSNQYTDEKIFQHEEVCKKLGIESALKKINDKEIDTEKNQIKVNLPDTIEKFKTGNGEGVWAVPYSEEDLKICNSLELNKDFNVVLLNQPICYPLQWGSVITVKTLQKDCRPVLSRDWISNVIFKSTDNKLTLEKFLNHL